MTWKLLKIELDVNQCQCQSWIYTAHKRETSNALTVLCERKSRLANKFQIFFEQLSFAVADVALSTNFKRNCKKLKNETWLYPWLWKKALVQWSAYPPEWHKTLCKLLVILMLATLATNNNECRFHCNNSCTLRFCAAELVNYTPWM